MTFCKHIAKAAHAYQQPKLAKEPFFANALTKNRILDN